MDSRFLRKPLPERFCNVERLLAAMAAHKLDGIVVSTPLNVFYLSGFNGIAHKADEPRPYAVLLSRHAPEHPILVLADYYLATVLSQPTWVRDVRPFRAVMMPIDRAAQREDIDRFIPQQAKQLDWVRTARERYAFDMNSALRGALAELGLDRGRVGFDDLALGSVFARSRAAVDAYDALMYARAVKTPTEIDLLRRATALNRAAIERTVADLGQRHALARAEPRLPRRGARPRRLRARPGRDGMGPSARRREARSRCKPAWRTSRSSAACT